MCTMKRSIVISNVDRSRPKQTGFKGRGEVTGICKIALAVQQGLAWPLQQAAVTITMAEEYSPFAALFGSEEIDASMLSAEIGSKTYNETMKKMALGAQERQEAHAQQLAVQEERFQQEQQAALYADLMRKPNGLSVDMQREGMSESGLSNLSTQVEARSEHDFKIEFSPTSSPSATSTSVASSSSNGYLGVQSFSFGAMQRQHQSQAVQLEQNRVVRRMISPAAQRFLQEQRDGRPPPRSDPERLLKATKSSELKTRARNANRRPVAWRYNKYENSDKVSGISPMNKQARAVSSD